MIYRQGKGRLYYRLSLNYSPQNPAVKALSRGFEVFRHYSAANSAPDHKDDVTQEDTWKIKKGAVVVVHVRMVRTLFLENIQNHD